jgi:hypothetical protein
MYLHLSHDQKAWGVFHFAKRAIEENISLYKKHYYLSWRLVSKISCSSENSKRKIRKRALAI